MNAVCIECRHCTINRDSIGRIRYWCDVHGTPALCGEERASGECGSRGALFVEKPDPSIANVSEG